MLDDACSLFAVQRSWLDGAEDRVFPIHRFYKQPREFAEFLITLKTASLDEDIAGVVLATIDPTPGSNALLVLHETVGWIGDKAIYRYYFCDEWVLRYWKSRAYLTACVAIAWRQNVFIHGVFLDKQRLQQLAAGRALPSWSEKGIWAFGVKQWDPEDMALRPEVFLDGLDSETDSHGHKEALKLWLNLFDAGHMNTGLGMYSGDEIRLAFSHALEQID